MNISVFGCELYVGRLLTVSGPKFGFKFKTKAHQQAEDNFRKWRRKALVYYDELKVLESRMRALDPSFWDTYKPLDHPYK